MFYDVVLTTAITLSIPYMALKMYNSYLSMINETMLYTSLNDCISLARGLLQPVMNTEVPEANSFPKDQKHSPDGKECSCLPCTMLVHEAHEDGQDSEYSEDEVDEDCEEHEDHEDDE